MTVEPDLIITDHEPAKERGWSNSLTWGALLTLGWTIYEITARPTLAIVVICTKFGWDDLLTGIWILRRDPCFGRGRTCFLFYLASSLWRTTVAAMLFSGFVLTLQVAVNERKPAPMLVGAGATVFVGVSLLAIVPLLALISARITGARIWIDSRVHDSRRADTWPPVCSSVNFISNLLFPALLVPIPLTAILSFRLGTSPLLMLALMFGEGLLMWSLFRRVAAATPEECWGVEEALEITEFEDDPGHHDDTFEETSDYGRRS